MTLALVACGGDKAAPTTTAPEGFTVMSDAKEGFAVAVPSDWVRIPLKPNPADFDTDANELRRQNPKLASILNQARVLGQSGGKFMAVAPDGVANVNLTADKPKEKTVDEIVTNSIEGLKSFEASNFAQEQATLSGKPAVRLSFRLPVDTDAGRIPTDEIQHYLLEDEKAYILTVAAAAPPVASAIAGSLKLR
ncbi:MAG: hypothetical protein AVDCRST_MAG10-226 [uncultured Acidimicrobiales bacterium]|uniref:Uncharacterized protein n=1 Tax=uncultured Acidimicrobiales bacterium TaxID=310071 RepID=A0A6J4H2C7_9ACTN|nr:MAG: hypothetical protein AVDCRST_MAG10-226 [uncultured Acidimicrobiales bacterium]